MSLGFVREIGQHSLAGRHLLQKNLDRQDLFNTTWFVDRADLKSLEHSLFIRENLTNLLQSAVVFGGRNSYALKIKASFRPC